MAEEKKPYIESKPGDLWTAEIWNGAQVMIRKDIEVQASKIVKAFRDEIDKNGVNSAKNAEKLGGTTLAEWNKYLDQNFAPMNHEHERMGGYFRCFKRFTKENDKVLINHRLHGNPIVDIWEMAGQTHPTNKNLGSVKFILYHSSESKELNMTINILGTEVIKGVRWVDFLKEMGWSPADQDRLGNAARSFWANLFSGENDEMEHAESKGIYNREMKIIADLKKDGDLKDIMLYFEPVNRSPNNLYLDQLNYDTLLAMGADVGEKPVDFMFLLRT
ncbi:MAG: hypothetical protein PHW87_10740 [Methanothrix sp.]|nr:hypothetical protein [Methanothrix sp.]